MMTDHFCRKIGIVLALMAGWLTGALAQTNAPTPPASAALIELSPAVTRYEQMLLQSPEKGTSFDKIYQFFLQGAGLEALAQRWAKSAAAHDAEEPAYLLMEGLLADRRGRTADARAYYQDAAKAAPANYRVWAALAALEASEGHLKDSVAASEKALANNPPATVKPDIYRQLARAKQRNFDEAGALETWKQFVAEFPSDTFALEEAGAAYVAAEKYDDAKAIYQKLADAAPENSYGRVSAIIKLAEVDERRGKSQDALHQYEAALPKSAESSWINRDLRARIEQIYRRQDDLPGLAAYYKRWLENNPRDVEATMRLGATLGELGRQTEALDALRKAMALAPDRKEVKATLITRLLDAAMVDEAVQVATALTQLDGTDPRNWELLGEAQWKQHAPPTPESKAAALASWRKIAPAELKKPGPILRLATLLRDHNLNDEAIAEYRRALELTPDAVETRVALADYLAELKRPEESLAVLNGLVEGTRATGENYLRLANALRKQQRGDDAGKAIDQGLKLDPKNFDLLQARWDMFSSAQKWEEASALFPELIAAAPNVYFAEQLEARQIQALAMIKKSDATEAALLARVGGQPPLSETDTRLLLRLLEAHNAEEDWQRVMAEGRTRFPNSVSLVRIDIAHAKMGGKEDAVVAGYQRLIDLAPAQKIDWLTEIARTQQAQGKPNDALATAGKIIEASPANVAGYLLYADLAAADGKDAEVIEKLRAAVKIADNPNEVRLRLVRAYQDQSDYPHARATADEAFEQAATPQDKLGLMKMLAEVYFQSGQVETLIDNLREKQRGEEGGWRYGAYLAEVFIYLQDFAAARRELALSLAARPTDTALIRQLITLSEKEGDAGEELRYLQRLAEVEPTPATQVALARQYVDMERLPEAWKIVEANVAALRKDPAAWRDILMEFRTGEEGEKVRALLKQAYGGDGADAASLLAYGEFALAQQDQAEAREALWKLVSLPLPAANGAAPAPPASSSMNPYFYQPVQVPLGSTTMVLNLPLEVQMRTNQMNLYTYQQAYSALLARGPNRRQSYSGGNSPFAAPAPPSRAQAQAARDRALVYLALSYVQSLQTKEFMARLKEKLDSPVFDASERLIAITVLVATDLMQPELDARLASKDGDQLADLIALNLQGYARYQPVDGLVPKEEIDRRNNLGRTLAQRVVKGRPEEAKLARRMTLNDGLAFTDGKVDRVKQRQAVTKFVAELDRNDPGEIIAAIGVARMAGLEPGDLALFPLLKKAMKDVSDPTCMALFQQQIRMMPYSWSLNADPKATPAAKEIGAQTIAATLALDYPDKPAPATIGAGSTSALRYRSDGAFPPANRYFTDMQLGVLENAVQQTIPAGYIPLVDQALEQQAQSLPEWQRVYPRFLSMCFNWWKGDKEKAVTIARALAAKEDSDDLHLLLASMLIAQEKYADALVELAAVKARFGRTYAATQKQILLAAKLGKDTEQARKAALRLTVLPINPQDRNALVEDLRQLGLTEKADELAKRNQRTNVNARNNTSKAQEAINAQFTQLLGKKDFPAASALARQVLAADPIAALLNGRDNNVRRTALNSLNSAGQLKPYIDDLTTQLAAAPNSARLHALLAEAYDGGDRDGRETTGTILPLWMKLRREGNLFIGSTSMDGQAWHEMMRTTLALPPRLYLGLITASKLPNDITTSTVDSVSKQGKFEAPTALGAGREGWMLADVGEAAQPGESTLANGVFKMAAKSGNIGREPADGFAYTYQVLQGDGEIVARVTDFKPTHDWAKVGLMARESLEAGSRHVTLALAKSGDILWPSRRETNEVGVMEAKGSIAPPFWLKLERKGGELIASISPDGQEWRVFTQQAMELPADIYFGLVTRGLQPATPARSTWEKVTVAGAAPAGSATGAPANGLTPTKAYGDLPAPWLTLDDSGKGKDGVVKFTGDQIEMTTGGAPANLRTTIYHPLHGDGAIIGKLDAFTGVNEDGTGFSILIPNPAGSSSENVMLALTPNGFLEFKWNATNSSRAAEHYQRVAELNPKNQPLLMKLAAQLAEKAPAVAAQIYLNAAKADLPAFLEFVYNDSDQVASTLRTSGKLGDFTALIQTWTPPPPNPYSSDYSSYALASLASDLPNTPEAIILLQKARVCDPRGNNMENDAKLAGLLLLAKRQDEARQVIRESLLPARQEQKDQIKLLNMGERNYGYRWLNQNSYGSSGYDTLTPLRLMRAANDNGLLPALLPDAEARAKNEGSDFDAKMVVLFGKILLRDPTYAKEMTGFLPDKNGGSRQELNYMAQCPQLFYNLASELSAWPSEHATAVQLLTAVLKQPPTQTDSYWRQLVMRQQIAAAMDVGDPALIRDTLSGAAKVTQELVVTGSQNLDASSITAILQQLLNAGMLAEAEKLATVAPESPRVRGDSNSRATITALNKEAAWWQGREESKPRLTATLLPGKGDGKATVMWTMNVADAPGKSLPPSPYEAPTISRGAPPRPPPRPMDIEVLAGKTADNLTRIATVTKAPTSGATDVKLPAGTNFVKVRAALKPAPAPKNGENGKANVPVAETQAMVAKLAPPLPGHATVGIAMQDISPSIAGALRLSSKDGILIAAVTPDGPAARAQLKAGDVVTAWGETPIKNMLNVKEALAAEKPGAKVVLTILREDEQQGTRSQKKVEVTLDEVGKAPAAVVDDPNVVESQLVIAPVSGNLLPDPNMTATVKTEAGAPAVATWSSTKVFSARPAATKPQVKSTALHLATTASDSARAFMSPPIKIDPASNYVFSGWMQSSPSDQVRFGIQQLDAGGAIISAVVNPVVCPAWTFKQKLIGGSAPGAIALLPNAASIQVMIESRYPIEVADLFVGKINPVSK